MSTDKKSNQIRIVCKGEVMRSPEEITPYGPEARRHREEQVERLRESLRAYGFVRPLLIDGEDRLVCGRAVLLAARAEGMDRVPCNVVKGLTDEQRRGYILADDRLAELSEWDREVLGAELADLAALGVDIGLIGFGAEDLEVPGLEDGEEEAPSQEEAHFRYQEQYGVIVLCTDEGQQQTVYEDLTAQGYACKVVAT